MAGTSIKTELVTFRVPVETAAIWKAEAERRGMKASTYILWRAMRPDATLRDPAPLAVGPKEAHPYKRPDDPIAKSQPKGGALSLLAMPVLTDFPKREATKRPAGKK